MATTTATITLSSTDLLSDELALTTSSTLTGHNTSTGVLAAIGLSRITISDTSETTIFNGFSETEENTMLVDALSGAPSAGHYVNLADYGVASTSAEDLLKDMYVFVDPKCNVASVASAKQFTVTAADAAKLFTGAIIEVHNSTYSNSSEGKIASITSGGGATETVVLENDLTYTPSSTDIIDLIGFNVDSGKPYRVI